jgi:cell division protein FtsQ
MTPALSTVLRVVFGLGASLGLAAAGWYGYDAIGRRPVAFVSFTGESARVPAADLERLAAGLRGREGREVALPALREAVRRLPWVRDCAVRRRFPDSLEIAIEAHVPLARWDDSHLVSDRGEVFAAQYEGALPVFSGPERSAGEMAALWPAVRAASAALESPVTELRLSQRRAWQVKLASGLVIDLGRGEIEARLFRFARAWPLAAAEARSATRADLRYSSGFALRIPPAPQNRAAGRGRGA